MPVGSLDITMYRDDLRLRGVRALETTESRPTGVDGQVVVLVDDVLFSGRTVRAALDALGDLGRPVPCSSPCSSTAATASCRSAPTTSARTSPPPCARAVHVLLAEIDGRDAVLLGAADAARTTTSEGDQQ